MVEQIIFNKAFPYMARYKEKVFSLLQNKIEGTLKESLRILRDKDKQQQIVDVQGINEKIWEKEVDKVNENDCYSSDNDEAVNSQPAREFITAKSKKCFLDLSIEQVSNARRNTEMSYPNAN